VFSSGHDLSEMLEGDAVFYRTVFDTCTEMMEAIRNLPQPVIAQVQEWPPPLAASSWPRAIWPSPPGSTLCHARGAHRSLLSYPQVPLSRAVGRKRALEMLLTGRPISAEEAERYGLVNRVVPGEKLAEETLALARHIAQASPLTLALGKQSFYRQIELEERGAYDYTKEMMSLNALTEDAQEGISAFLNKRPPKWKGK